MGRRGEGRDRGQDMVAKEQKMQGIRGELKWDTPYRVDVIEELAQICILVTLPELQIVELFGSGCDAVTRVHFHFDLVDHLRN